MNGTDTEPSLASIKEQGQTEYLLGLFSYLYNLILSSVTYTVVIRLLRCINGLWQLLPPLVKYNQNARSGHSRGFSGSTFESQSGTRGSSSIVDSSRRYDPPRRFSSMRNESSASLYRNRDSMYGSKASLYSTNSELLSTSSSSYRRYVPPTPPSSRASSSRHSGYSSLNGTSRIQRDSRYSSTLGSGMGSHMRSHSDLGPKSSNISSIQSKYTSRLGDSTTNISRTSRYGEEVPRYTPGVTSIGSTLTATYSSAYKSVQTFGSKVFGRLLRNWWTPFFGTNIFMFFILVFY